MAQKSKQPPALIGPRLVDHVLELIDAKQMTPTQVSKEFGVSRQWLYEMRNDPTRSPQADTVQHMYEQLTGRTLL